jgi:hypothetical protein
MFEGFGDPMSPLSTGHNRFEKDVTNTVSWWKMEN